MSCGVGHCHSSDPVLLCLWCRPAAVAPIPPLAWDPPCATGRALKRKKTYNSFYIYISKKTSRTTGTNKFANRPRLLMNRQLRGCSRNVFRASHSGAGPGGGGGQGEEPGQKSTHTHGTHSGHRRAVWMNVLTWLWNLPRWNTLTPISLGYCLFLQQFLLIWGHEDWPQAFWGQL